jgi:hypothetical protein
MKSHKTQKALVKCAYWLLYCLSIGWAKEELDELEKIWWRYHDRFGNLKK